MTGNILYVKLVEDLPELVIPEGVELRPIEEKHLDFVISHWPFRGENSRDRLRLVKKGLAWGVFVDDWPVSWLCTIR